MLRGLFRSAQREGSIDHSNAPCTLPVWSGEHLHAPDVHEYPSSPFTSSFARFCPRDPPPTPVVDCTLLYYHDNKKNKNKGKSLPVCRFHGKC